MKLLVVGVVLLAAGCPDRTISPVVTIPAAVATKNIPVTADLDILFVIDNSASTKDKQTVFAQNYPRFVQALDGFPIGRPNLHIGVVTTSVDIGNDSGGKACHPASGQNGTLQNASLDPGFVCTPPTTDRFLSDIARSDGTRDTNYTGTLEDALSCISHVGDAGCGFESPLEAMKRALDGSRPENARFLRPGAFLAVVILTDEDDCSAQLALFEQPTTAVGKDDFRCGQSAYRCDRAISPSAPASYTGCTVRHDGYMNKPSDYADFLVSLKGAAGVAVALIAGDPTTSVVTGPLDFIRPDGSKTTQELAVEPTCHATINGNLAIGRPSLRLNELVTSFGDRGLFRTVCQSDYSGALADIGALLFAAVSPCLEGSLDTRDIDSGNPGLQPDCTVSDVEAPDTDAQVETAIPRCRMAAEDKPQLNGGRACWWVAPNPDACVTETQLELRVERAAPASPNTTVRVSCAIAAP